MWVSATIFRRIPKAGQVSTDRVRVDEGLTFAWITSNPYLQESAILQLTHCATLIKDELAIGGTIQIHSCEEEWIKQKRYRPITTPWIIIKNVVRGLVLEAASALGKID